MRRRCPSAKFFVGKGERGRRFPGQRGFWKQEIQRWDEEKGPPQSLGGLREKNSGKILKAKKELRGGGSREGTLRENLKKMISTSENQGGGVEGRVWKTSRRGGSLRGNRGGGKTCGPVHQGATEKSRHSSG